MTQASQTNNVNLSSVLYTLFVNVIVAALYFLVFLFIRKFCGQSARENAKGLGKRSHSFFQKLEKEHDEKILMDLAKDADSFQIDDKSNIIKKDQMADLFVNEHYDQKEDDEIATRKIISSIHQNKGEIKTSFGSFSCQQIEIIQKMIAKEMRKRSILQTQNNDDDLHGLQDEPIIDDLDHLYSDDDQILNTESDHQKSAENLKPFTFNLEQEQINHINFSLDQTKELLSQNELKNIQDYNSAQDKTNSNEDSIEILDMNCSRSEESNKKSTNDNSEGIISEKSYDSNYEKFLLKNKNIQEKNIINESENALSKISNTKLQGISRMVNLQKQMGGAEWSAYKGLWDWTKLINRIDDVKLKKLCGTDVALYIIFLRYAYQFFFTISIINIFTIMIYGTGSPSQEDEGKNDVMQLITILNVSGTQFKVIVIYFACIMIVTGLLIKMIFKYMMKYQNFEKSDLELLEEVDFDESVNTPRKRNMSNTSNFTFSSETTFKNMKPSENPTDYGLKKYSDIEIADHSIMISGIPKGTPRKKLENSIKSLFEQVFKKQEIVKKKGIQIQETQIIKVSVISQYDKCMKMIQKFKLLAGKFHYCLDLNKKNMKKDPQNFEKYKIKKQQLWFFQQPEYVDAVETFKAEIESLAKEIRQEYQNQSEQNIGVCFVIFRDQLEAHRALNNKWLKNQFRQICKEQNISNLQINDWKINQAFVQSNIIWSNLGKNRFFAYFKRILFFFLIFVVSFVIITPTVAAQNLDFFQQFMLKNLYNERIKQFVVNYYQIVVSFLVNFVLIPFLIDLSVQFEDFRRKSSKQISIMRKTFFFMFINFIVLPIFQMPIENYIQKIQKDEINEVLSFAQRVSKNFNDIYIILVSSIIQLCFISNGFWLIDIFHRCYVFFGQKIHQYNERNSIIKTQYKDEYQFDLGYNQSYVLVIFLNCLLFCLLAPIISIFATLFFYIKYIIDKYNLIFVYFKIYESRGQIRKHVTNLMFFNMCCYLFIIFGFFYAKFNLQEYYYGGILISVTWILIYCLIRKNIMIEFKLDNNLNSQYKTVNRATLYDLVFKRFVTAHRNFNNKVSDDSLSYSSNKQLDMSYSKNHRQKSPQKKRNSTIHDNEIQEHLITPRSYSDQKKDKKSYSIKNDVSAEIKNEFRQKMSTIIEYNEQQLIDAYKHPFQRVNKKLYQNIDQHDTQSLLVTKLEDSVKNH